MHRRHSIVIYAALILILPICLVSREQPTYPNLTAELNFVTNICHVSLRNIAWSRSDFIWVCSLKFWFRWWSQLFYHIIPYLSISQILIRILCSESYIIVYFLFNGLTSTNQSISTVADMTFTSIWAISVCTISILVTPVTFFHTFIHIWMKSCAEMSIVLQPCLKQNYILRQTPNYTNMF